ncbi:Amino acid transporter transmembrane domain-containing protein [Entamoeba marina]
MDDVQVEEKLKGINLLSVFSMVLNVMVGAGVFGMPLAYEGAGLVLTVITALYLLEGIARVSTYLKRLKILGGDVDCNVEIYETYGYTSIASAIGGKAFKITINVLIVINLLTVLWAFVGTSVGTLSSVYWSFYDDYDRCDVVGHFHKGWECQVTYYGTMAVFAIVAVPLSYIKLGSQSIVHILLMIYAIACFTLLIGTCILEIIENGLSYEVKYFEIKGFGTVFSHSALALVCNLSVPDIIRPARNKKKVQYPIIVAVSVATMFYGCVGSVGSITFGDEIKSPVTLNWGNYTGIDGGWGSGETLWFAYIVRYFIMFFPIVNVLSSFPIVAASTSSNVESMFSPKIKMNHERIIHYSSLTFCIIVPFLFGKYIIIIGINL